MEPVNNNTLKAIVAMLCVTSLEIVAVMQGIDGALMGAAIAALAGLGGYALAKRQASDDVY